MGAPGRSIRSQVNSGRSATHPSRGPRDAARHGLGSLHRSGRIEGGAMVTQGFPAEGMELTHILVVGDGARARDFYRDVLGAELYREYGGTSVVLRLLGASLLVVTRGGATPRTAA